MGTLLGYTCEDPPEGASPLYSHREKAELAAVMPAFDEWGLVLTGRGGPRRNPSIMVLSSSEDNSGEGSEKTEEKDGISRAPPHHRLRDFEEDDDDDVGERPQAAFPRCRSGRESGASTTADQAPMVGAIPARPWSHPRWPSPSKGLPRPPPRMDAQLGPQEANPPSDGAGVTHEGGGGESSAAEKKRKWNAHDE